MIYKRTGASSIELESTGFGSGRINKTSGGYEVNYHLTDHLGSTRVAFKPSGSSNTIVERNDYYPFGGRHDNPQLAMSTTNRFRFSGKEDQTTGELPYQDFGARFFGGKLPIFTGPDPLSEDDFPTTPYAYTGNNPINRIDKDGRKWVDAKGRLVWYNGAYTQYATADHRRIGDNLRRTSTGWEQFDKLVNHSADIQTVIDTKNAPVNEIGTPIRGYASRGKDSKSIVRIGVITLYEKNIEWAAEKNAISNDEQLASTTGHEIEHFSEDNMQYGEGNSNVELKPEEVSLKIIDEFKTQRPIATPRFDIFHLENELEDPRRIFYGGGW